MCRARHAHAATTALTDATHREVCTWSPTQRSALGANWSGTEQRQDTYANYTGQGYPHTTKTKATIATQARVQNEQTKSPGEIIENASARNGSSQGAQEVDPSSPRARHYMDQSHRTTHKTTYTMQQHTESKKKKRNKNKEEIEGTPKPVVNHKRSPPPTPQDHHPHQLRRIIGKSPCLHSLGTVAPSCPSAHMAHTGQRRQGSQSSHPPRGKMHIA